MRSLSSATHLQIVSNEDFEFRHADIVKKFMNLLGMTDTVSDAFTAAIPFSLNDVTVGVENEFQTVIEGNREQVDLPVTVRESNYYKNILKRSSAGDTCHKVVSSLNSYLNDNHENIWENSWVRIAKSVLTPYANHILDHDILADKANPASPMRGDTGRFLFLHQGQEFIRTPVSYLLKLSLADVVCPSRTHPTVKETGDRLMKHFLSDNTSPETFSFHPVPLNTEWQCGRGIAKETSKRFLLCQFLVQYANRKFQLQDNGQRAMLYFAPNPPIRQKLLNDLISDTFYRELFMNPCLSGWDRGEEKHRYMELCHQVLSRSQLNGVAKLKEAGIITKNLVVLPNTSNISLANNGTHISIGSRKLTDLLSHKTSGFTSGEEKCFGDLAIKTIEHFLPLFVGRYSAAPYRIDFWDFHPEKALGFLPHELDFTHLRMIWRRWKKKAHLSFLGRPMTPFGPEAMDKFISRVLGLKGDFITDFRLIDYLVCLMSTDQSPALDGQPGNDIRLINDLSDLGVFDPSIALYLLYRLRDFGTMGFSGFEGRHYSQFASLEVDMAEATNLQCLITALAFKYILKRKVNHTLIPNDPFVESERRQIFFGSAIGLPTFYVKKNTPNQFLAGILKKTKNIRSSRRYPGYFRILNIEYCKALLEILKTEASDLIEMMDMHHTTEDLEKRIEDPDAYSAGSRLTSGILNHANMSTPLKLSGHDFNCAAERYYRDALRIDYMKEAFDFLKEDFKKIDSWKSWREGYYNQALLDILGGKSAVDFLLNIKDDIIKENASADNLRKLIHVTILTIHQDIEKAGA